MKQTLLKNLFNLIKLLNLFLFQLLLSVIPAVLRPESSPEIKSFWIPAFAGMTKTDLYAQDIS